ncbi:unnamed protein product [Lathyrus oleraceus]
MSYKDGRMDNISMLPPEWLPKLPGIYMDIFSFLKKDFLYLMLFSFSTFVFVIVKEHLVHPCKKVSDNWDAYFLILNFSLKTLQHTSKNSRRLASTSKVPSL